MQTCVWTSFGEGTLSKHVCRESVVSTWGSSTGGAPVLRRTWLCVGGQGWRLFGYTVVSVCCLQGASGHGAAHAAYPCAVLRGKAGLQSYYVCLLARCPLIAACAPDLHARGTGVRLWGLFWERGQLRMLAVGAAGLQSCRVARAAPVAPVVAGPRVLRGHGLPAGTREL